MRGAIREDKKKEDLFSKALNWCFVNRVKPIDSYWLELVLKYAWPVLWGFSTASAGLSRIFRLTADGKRNATAGF